MSGVRVVMSSGKAAKLADSIESLSDYWLDVLAGYLGDEAIELLVDALERERAARALRASQSSDPEVSFAGMADQVEGDDFAAQGPDSADKGGA